MKIALIIPYNPLEEVGGLELAAVRQAAAFTECGHEAAILTKGETGTMRGASITGFPSLAELCRHLLGQPGRYDIVHWLEIFPDPGEVELQGMCSSMLRSFGVTVVYMVATSGNLRNRGTGSLATPLMQRAADAYVVSNPEQLTEFAESGITERVHVIGFGIDTRNEFCPVTESEKRALRSALGLTTDKVLCLFVGRFVERKRPDFLLRSWRLLTELHERSELVVVGSGMGQHDSIEGALSSLIGSTDHVQFRDITDRPQRYYQACDLLLLPSCREGQPNVLMEMMACGNPVVGSDIPGIRELLIDKVNGLLFPVEDDRAFCQAVASLVLDAGRRTTLGRAARQTIVDVKDIGQVTRTYLDFYRTLRR